MSRRDEGALGECPQQVSKERRAPHVREDHKGRRVLQVGAGGDGEGGHGEGVSDGRSGFGEMETLRSVRATSFSGGMGVNKWKRAFCSTLAAASGKQLW